MIVDLILWTAGVTFVGIVVTAVVLLFKGPKPRP